MKSLKKEGGLREGRSKGPLISIVTVCLNSAEYLERAIQSVINQSYDNVEYIIIDGGSTDGTIDIIKKHEDFIDYWVSEPDKGLYDAMNKGANIAKGDWVNFLGSDDVMVNSLSRIIPYLQNNNVIYYGDVYSQKKHVLYNGETSRYKLLFANICHQSMFYPKRVFDKYSYNLEYPIWADYDLNLRCCGNKGFDFCYIPILVSIFNDLTGLNARYKDIKFIRDRETIVKKNFPIYLYILFCVRHAIARFLKRIGVKKSLI